MKTSLREGAGNRVMRGSNSYRSTRACSALCANELRRVVPLSKPAGGSFSQPGDMDRSRPKKNASRRPPVAIDPQVFELMAIDGIRSESLHKRLLQIGPDVLVQRHELHTAQQIPLAFAQPGHTLGRILDGRRSGQHRVVARVRPTCAVSGGETG